MELWSDGFEKNLYLSMEKPRETKTVANRENGLNVIGVRIDGCHAAVSQASRFRLVARACSPLVSAHTAMQYFQEFVNILM